MPHATQHTPPKKDAVPVISPQTPWLAPLAGYSDLPFRLLCLEYGAAATCTEMISAKGLVYKSPGTEALLATTEQDSPLVLQLYGADPELAGQAMDELLRRGFAWFDLNAGCPVKKVTKTFCGAAMLRDDDTRARLYGVVREMVRRAGAGRVGVKFRLGWFLDQDMSIEIGQELEQLGVGWLTLHPRTAKQGFSGHANWEALARLKAAVNIPVIGSGDIITAEDGVRMIRETGVDGIMFARGAMADPAVFSRYLALLNNEPTPRAPAGEIGDKTALLTLIHRHMELAVRYGGEHKAQLKMRTFVPRYLRHIPGARALRKEFVSCRSLEEINTLLQTFLNGERQHEEQ